MKTPTNTPLNRTFKTCALALAAAAPLLIGSLNAEPEAKKSPAKTTITEADFPDAKVMFATKGKDQGVPLKAIGGHYFLYSGDSNTGFSNIAKVIITPQEDGTTATIVKTDPKKVVTHGVARSLVFENDKDASGSFLAVKWDGTKEVIIYKVRYRADNEDDITIYRNEDGIHETMVFKARFGAEKK